MNKKIVIILALAFISIIAIVVRVYFFASSEIVVSGKIVAINEPPVGSFNDAIPPRFFFQFDNSEGKIQFIFYDLIRPECRFVSSVPATGAYHDGDKIEVYGKRVGLFPKLPFSGMSFLNTITVCGLESDGYYIKRTERFVPTGDIGDFCNTASDCMAITHSECTKVIGETTCSISSVCIDNACSCRKRCQ